MCAWHDAQAAVVSPVCTWRVRMGGMGPRHIVVTGSLCRIRHAILGVLPCRLIAGAGSGILRREVLRGFFRDVANRHPQAGINRFEMHAHVASAGFKGPTGVGRCRHRQLLYPWPSSLDRTTCCNCPSHMKHHALPLSIHCCGT